MNDKLIKQTDTPFIGFCFVTLCVGKGTFYIMLS